MVIVQVKLVERKASHPITPPQVQHCARFSLTAYTSLRGYELDHRDCGNAATRFANRLKARKNRSGSTYGIVGVRPHAWLTGHQMGTSNEKSVYPLFLLKVVAEVIDPGTGSF